MNRKISAVLAIVLVVTCIFSFVACGDDTDYRNPNAASTVREVEFEEIDGNIVSNITSFKDFKKSKFNIKSSLGDEYSKIFYNKQYFEEKNLIAVKFNELKGSNFYIKNVEMDGNDINVSLLQKVISDKSANATYCLFLEVAKSVRADKVNITVANFDGENVVTPIYSIVPDGAKPLDARVLCDSNALDTYVNAGDNIIMKSYVEKYGEKFFAKENIVVAKVLLRSSARVYLSTNDNALVIDAYATEHYAESDRDLEDTSYRAIFIPIPKDTNIIEVVLNTHLEADLGAPEVVESYKVSIGA